MQKGILPRDEKGVRKEILLEKEKLCPEVSFSKSAACMKCCRIALAFMPERWQSALESAKKPALIGKLSRAVLKIKTPWGYTELITWGKKIKIGLALPFSPDFGVKQFDLSTIKLLWLIRGKGRGI